jgi:hypothetical protein
MRGARAFGKCEERRRSLLGAGASRASLVVVESFSLYNRNARPSL